MAWISAKLTHLYFEEFHLVKSLDLLVWDAQGAFHPIALTMTIFELHWNRNPWKLHNQAVAK